LNRTIHAEAARLPRSTDFTAADADDSFERTYENLPVSAMLSFDDGSSFGKKCT
jgi:hypothetical protein